MNFAEAFSNILAKLGGFDGKFDALSAQISELKQSNGTATAELEAKVSEIADLKAQLNAAPKPEDLKAAADKVTELQSIVEGEPQRTNAALAAELAKFGHAPVKPGTQPAGDSFSAQLEAIKDPTERDRFFKANRAAIRAENLQLKQSK
jgi:hypothetical protein